MYHVIILFAATTLLNLFSLLHIRDFSHSLCLLCIWT